MKKQLLAGVLAASMVLPMVGCGNQKTADTTTAAKKDEEITCDLTVWGPQEDQSEEKGNWLKKECEAFASEHPSWHITFNYGVCSEADAKTNVTTDVAKAADVYMYANDQIPTLVSAGALAELGGTTVDNMKKDNSETMVQSVTYKNAIYGVPFTGNTWFMYYDKSKYTEADVKNLDTMLQKGKVAFPLSNSWYIAAFYTGNGCTLFGKDGTDASKKIDFTGDKAVDVTKYLVDLANNDNFINDENGVGVAGLANGSVNAIFSGSWDYDNVKKALGDNMGIAIPPTYTLNGKQVQMKAFGGSKAIGVNPNCKNPQVAVALAAYLGGEKAQKDHFTMRGILPTMTKVDVGNDALAKAQAETLSKASTVQPLLAEMGTYWTPAESMGKEIVAKTVTKDNAKEKTESMNTAMNTSSVG
jgi:arabinogalactan oligomer/maltooligosaccharide transport system substrate-binding protein